MECPKSFTDTSQTSKNIIIDKLYQMHYVEELRGDLQKIKDCDKPKKEWYINAIKMITSELETNCPEFIDHSTVFTDTFLEIEHSPFGLAFLACHFPYLESLNIVSCAALQSLEGLDKFSKLKDIKLHDCINLHDISMLEKCPSLENLYLDKCGWLAKPSQEVEAQITVLKNKLTICTIK
jgi:hypothetical protein